MGGILTVPTLLAGIYGMNFRYLPELNWRFGYPLVLVVMVVICLWLYRTFRLGVAGRRRPAARGRLPGPLTQQPTASSTISSSTITS